MKSTINLRIDKNWSFTMYESRMQKSIKNSVFGIIGMFAMLIVSFISKSIFIKILGNEYNGVNYLFTGILNALNLAEMGFAGAVAFALYKPLSINDNETISALMNFFKNVYRIVALVVAILGSLCIPFLEIFIKDEISTLPFTLNRLRIYYSIFLINTVLSYLLAYKRTIITADQKAYIVTSVDYGCNIILNILQIILLIITKNYYAYLIIMVAKTIINNVILSCIANKRYPYLTKYKNAKLLPNDKKQLFDNVRALMLHKIGTVIILNSSTIVISALVGLFENSLYGNYLMIATQVMSCVNIIFNAVTASVGNLCASEDNEKQIEIFNNMNYLTLWLGYFVFICYICLFNPFMDIWLGPNNTFEIYIVIMISINQCLAFLRRSINTFKDAKGMFRVDRYKPIIESIVGIILAMVLGKYWGIFGILFGFTFASLAIAMPVEKWALFRKGFNISSKKYVLIDILIIIFTAIMSVVMYFITNLIGDGVGNFILKLLLCITIPNIIFILLTFRTKEFKYYFSLIRKILKRK